jgi:short-subunit dehydrogenase
MQKNVVITGSNGALGWELVKIFLKKKNYLIIHSRKKLDKKKISYLKNYKNFKILNGDLQKNSTINKFSLLKKKIDIFINNAAIYDNISDFNFSKKYLSSFFDINFIAPVLVTQKLLKNLSLANGIIVNINSLSGKKGNKDEIIYSLTKNMLRIFFETMEDFLIKKNINILNIYSGAFKSKITKSRKTFNKLMSPDEVAKLIYDSIYSYNSLKIKDISFIRKKF